MLTVKCIYWTIENLHTTFHASIFSPPNRKPRVFQCRVARTFHLYFVYSSKKKQFILTVLSLLKDYFFLQRCFMFFLILFLFTFCFLLFYCCHKEIKCSLLVLSTIWYQHDFRALKPLLWKVNLLLFVVLQKITTTKTTKVLQLMKVKTVTHRINVVVFKAKVERIFFLWNIFYSIS